MFFYFGRKPGFSKSRRQLGRGAACSAAAGILSEEDKKWFDTPGNKEFKKAIRRAYDGQRK